MKKTLLLLALTAICSPVFADSPPANPSALTPNPWEKFSVSLGAFISNTNTGVRIGSGVGLDVDVEEVLGLDAQTSVFRADSLWRFTRNRRHRLDASWFALRRTANRTVGEDFDIEDRHGNKTTIQAGSNIESHFDLDIIETAYSYSFLQDERVDLAGIFGVYVMPISFGLKSSGLVDAQGSLSFTAPLPAIGFRTDVAITPKWFLRSNAQIFAIEYENFSGYLSQIRAAVEFLPIRHVGIGIGVDSMRFGVEGKGEDYPGVDLRGNVDFQYTGLQLYGKVFF